MAEPKSGQLKLVDTSEPQAQDATSPSETEKKALQKVLALLKLKNANVSRDGEIVTVFCANKAEPCSEQEPTTVYTGSDFRIQVCQQINADYIDDNHDGYVSWDNLLDPNGCILYAEEKQTANQAIFLVTDAELELLDRIENKMAGKEIGLRELMNAISGIEDAIVLRQVEIAVKEKRNDLKQAGKVTPSISLSVSTDQTGKERVYEVQVIDGRIVRRSLSHKVLMEYDISNVKLSNRAKEVINKIKASSTPEPQ